MPRRRVQRDPCDCLDCREGFPAQSDVGTAIARQQPPPKCLVIYIQEAIDVSQLSEREPVRVPCIDLVVDEGCSGLLALREGTQAELRDLENLFGTIPVTEQVTGKGAEDRGSALRSLSAVLVSDSAVSQGFGKTAGFSSTQALEEFGLCQDPTLAASKIADILGFPDLVPLDAPQKRKPASDDNETDLLFMILGKEAGNKEDGAMGHLQAVDRLLSSLRSQPKFTESVLLVLLVKIRDPSGGSFPRQGGAKLEGVHGLEMLVRPKQSFEFACLDDVEVSNTEYILSVQRLPYVVRRDGLSQFPWDLEKAVLGDGCVLAERLLPTLAYNLGCAPKYGA